MNDSPPSLDIQQFLGNSWSVCDMRGVKPAPDLANNLHSCYDCSATWAMDELQIAKEDAFGGNTLLFHCLCPSNSLH